jgi:site-specific recombinase XerD
MSKPSTHTLDFCRLKRDIKPTASHKGAEHKMSQESIRKQIAKYAESAHQICKKIPLDFHSHQFRHSMTVHRLEDDMNIVQLSKKLRHAKIETTMIYLDVASGKKEKAIAELESEEIKQLPRKWRHQTQKLKYLFKKEKR